MSTLGTFDSFTTARLGIYAAQHGLHITGNNISNINTDRYTRQRVDQVSFKTGSTDRYASWADNHMGSGVLVSGISQIRDPFLDIRYRTTATDTYYYDAKLSGLQDIATILDEVAKGDNDGDGLIYAQLQDVLKQLRAFSANPTSGNNDLVRESANSLASLFRHYANKLDELYENSKMDFDKSITKVNEILTNIRDLNESIRDAEIHGDKALEMRDERNRQIDELSKYMSIRVEYSYEDVGAGVQVEKLTIKMDNSNPDKSVHTDESLLVDGLYCTQLSVPDQKPVLNTYDTTKPEYAYLKDYLYLKEVSEDSEEYKALLEKFPDLEKIPALDETGNQKVGTDGKPLYLIGTNDAADEGIVTEKNDNFTVQLGKLLDRKGNVWKSTETTWQEVTGTPTSLNRWATTITNLNLSDNPGDNEFTINGITYTVVADKDFTGEDTTDPNKKFVKLSDVADSKALAKFVYNHLDSAKYADYNVSLDGNQIIFTAKKPGFSTPPDLNDEPENNQWIEADTQPIDPKPAVGPPAGINLDEYPKTTTDEFGNTTTIKYVQSGDQWYKLTVETKNAREIALDDNDLHGILQAQREMLTEEGEFSSAKDVAIDENACIKRGIPYYIHSLDLLAQKFAEAYNELNQGYKTDQDGNYLTEDNMYLRLAGEPVNKNKPLTKDQVQALVNLGDDYKKLLDNGSLTAEQLQALDDNGYVPLDDGTIVVKDQNGNAAVANLDAWLKDKNVSGSVPMGGPLFSNSNAGDNTTDPRINAHNIDISAGWSNGAWGVVPKFEVLLFAEGEEDLEHTTQNVNADHMVSLLLDKALTYNPGDLYGWEDAIGPKMFEGTFNDYLSNMMGVHAEDARITNVRLLTNDIALTELDYSREGVSGVDLNDEAMNMVQYQKAMNAAMRLMTAIDEALDRLINNTGVAGR